MAAVQRVLALIAGKWNEYAALQSSAGAGSSGNLVALNTSGFVDQTMIGPHAAAPYTVAALPTSGNVGGQLAWASNGRAITGVGTLGAGFTVQAAGAGTGCLVAWSASAAKWQIAGTTTTVAA